MPHSAQETDLMLAIEQERPGLSRKMQAIAGYALENTESFVRNTSREICAELGTSEPTLIKFCQHFGFAGLSDFRIALALSYANVARGSLVEPLAHDRRNVNMRQKQIIAERAVKLVADSRSLLIDNGSTAELFAAALRDAPPKTIMTTGLNTAQIALSHGQHEVLLTGGRIRPNALALTGRVVETVLASLRFDTFVMGADCVDPDLGLSTFREDEAHITRAMLDAANRVIVLADCSKLMKPSLHQICGLDRVDYLVTDLEPDDPLIARFEAHGVRVLTAEAEKELT
ncbi:DeoR/GlpR family DNA-binding transcription regulator [Maritimibacter fusiformis]|uniref:Transcriptional regulator n=1 Tax=Maritimibacter fusiformis TaxID=2603819 RepID=A0A5D0RMP2_9RHOB|nr:transcriptional regulator [Maritimibacter fusiformis]TYB82389.1 transcriptional regulator [Maritimibacter fusiformis]